MQAENLFMDDDEFARVMAWRPEPQRRKELDREIVVSRDSISSSVVTMYSQVPIGTRALACVSRYKSSIPRMRMSRKERSRCWHRSVPRCSGLSLGKQSIGSSRMGRPGDCAWKRSYTNLKHGHARSARRCWGASSSRWSRLATRIECVRDSSPQSSAVDHLYFVGATSTLGAEITVEYFILSGSVWELSGGCAHLRRALG